MRLVRAMAVAAAAFLWTAPASAQRNLTVADIFGAEAVRLDAAPAIKWLSAQSAGTLEIKSSSRGNFANVSGKSAAIWIGE